MSFSLPWTVNKLVSTNINNSNSITGTYSNTCSLKVNGNTELDGDTIIAHLGVNKKPSSTYALDVSGGVNATSLSISGSVDFTGTTNYYSLSNVNFQGIVFFSNPSSQVQFQLPPSYVGFTYTPAATDFMTRDWSDARYATLSGSQTFSGLTTFTGGITASGAQTITFGTNAPTMSGANISATSIPDTALSTNIAKLTGGQTFTGAKTFTGGITASGAQTITFGTNAPTMSGANISSASIPDTALSSNQATLTGSQTFSGAKTFTGGITASGTQTINFGTNAPSMSGANITSASIPDAALSSNQATLTGTQTFSGAKTFTGGITASGTQTINFGTNAPSMSGSNITSASIPDAALSTNVATLSGTQTFSGAKTFTGGITASGTQTITFGTNAPTMSGANISATSIPDGALSSNIPLKNGTNTYTGANTFSNLIFSNVSSNITVTNPAFQLPLESLGSNFTPLVSASSTTYAPNATFLTAQGFTGWGFSGTSYTAGIQCDVYGTYYMTYYPIGQQCVIMAPNGSNMNMKSQNYTLAKGEYTFSFQLQTQYMDPTSSIIASVILGSTTIESTTAINPSSYYPNWTTYQFGFVVPTSGSYYFNFAFTSTTGSDYVGISATTLVLDNCMSVSDGTNTSAIGGSQSVLNGLFVRNSLTIESGGMNVKGSVNMGTAYGSNNIAINSPMGSVVGTTNSGVIAIGTAALQNGSSLTNYIGIGTSGISSTSAAGNMVVIAGSCVSESNSTIIGWGVVSSAPVGLNAIVGCNIGSGVGDYNSVLGCNIFRAYNGYGTIFPNYNCVVGYNSQNVAADSYNTSVGVNSLALMDGLNGNAYNTQYNTAVGYNSGSSQARINYCTFLGSGADVNTNNLSYATAIGAGAIATASNGIYLGRSSDTTYCVGGLTIPSTKVLTLFGNISANATTITPTILGYISGLTSSAQTQITNITNGTTAFTGTVGLTNATFSGTLNTVSAATFAYISGLTSSAQTQITNLTNGTTAHTGTSSFVNMTFSGTLNTVSAATFAYISGLTSSAQTQINNILNGTSAFTGTVGLTNATFSGTLNTIPAATFAYISGLTSSAQTQINNILNGTSAFTGTVGFTNATFSGTLRSSNLQYINSSAALTTAATLTISSPYYANYPLAPTANMTITLPAASATTAGLRFQFRRTGGTTTTTINSATSNIYPNASLTLTNIILAASSYTISVYCTSDGTTGYAWYTSI